jgi:GT2 family glycosyltransferase
MMTMNAPTVSFVISTYNRRDVLLHTLDEIGRCGLVRGSYEIIVIDNASVDRTTEAVITHHQDVRLIRAGTNRGSCAKNAGIRAARGEYVVFLDDDSYPQPGSVARMVEHFRRQPSLGAAVFRVELSDGSRECSAYPNVFIGCGTGFRRSALIETGGLPNDFFMQAEEYDLSLRLMSSGWDIRTFDDLIVSHLKTPAARRHWRTMRLDVRNNLVVALKYLPRDWGRAFAMDWSRRYYRIAASKRQRLAFALGYAEGMIRSLASGVRSPVSADVFERFARIRQIRAELRYAKREHGLKSVLLVDYGKNILPYWLAAKKLGLNIVAVADNKLAGACAYRGIPIVNDWVARRLEFDAIIISNSSPVHAQQRAAAWRQIDNRPVIDLLRPHRSISQPLQLGKQTGLAA